MNESRTRAIAVKNGEDVKIEHPKEMYYGLAARLMRTMFVLPMSISSTQGPAEFQREFLMELHRRNQDAYYDASYKDQMLMERTLEDYLKVKDADVLDDLNSGASTAAQVSTQIPWTLRSRNNNDPVSKKQTDGSLRVVRGLVHSHLLALLPMSRLPKWSSPDGYTSKVLPETFTMNERGLWLPENFNREPTDSGLLGPRIGCPLSLDVAALRAFTNFVKNETTRPERRILTLTA